MSAAKPSHAQTTGVHPHTAPHPVPATMTGCSWSSGRREGKRGGGVERPPAPCLSLPNTPRLAAGARGEPDAAREREREISIDASEPWFQGELGWFHGLRKPTKWATACRGRGKTTGTAAIGFLILGNVRSYF